jgi:hypothetical protein
MTLADTTFYLFGFFNALRVFSYLPQIYRVAQDKNGATVISYWTWGLWTAANASTGAYALASLGDLPLAAISAMNTACCAVVIGLTGFKRHRFSRSRAPTDGANLFWSGLSRSAPE